MAISVLTTSNTFRQRINQVFTANGTFTPPSTVSSSNPLLCDITVTGGGGGGAGSTANQAGNGGNAGQSLYLPGYPVTGATTITVGAAGTAGTTGVAGGAGGSSSFGALVASGGAGGGLVVSQPATTLMPATATGGRAAIPQVAITFGTNTLSTSYDGITWTSRSIGTGHWGAAAYGNGTWVVIEAAYGTSQQSATSTDGGITWTVHPTALPASGTWQAITFGNGTFVAVGQNLCATSTDGITWTSRTVPNAAWQAVAYGNGVFAAVPNSGSSNAISSPDGVTWTTHTLPGGYTWESLVYGTYFVAIANASTTFCYSTDGLTWNSGSISPSAYWMGVAYGNGTYVVVSFGGGAYCATSTNPAGGWTTRTMSPSTGGYQYIGYSCGLFQTSSGSGQLSTSPDGITWTSRTGPTGTLYFSQSSPSAALAVTSPTSLIGLTATGGAAGNAATNGDGGKGGMFLPPALAVGTSSAAATPGQVPGAGGGGGGYGALSGAAGAAGLVTVSYWQ